MTRAKKRKKSVSLTWIRLEVKTHADPDVLDLPPCQRPVWYALMELGGEAKRRRGFVDFTDAQLARRLAMPTEDVTAAIDHLASERVGWVRREDNGVFVVNFRRMQPPLRHLSHAQRGEGATE